MITDTWKLANYHKLLQPLNSLHQEECIPIKQFAGILAYQLIEYANDLFNKEPHGMSPVTNVDINLGSSISVLSVLGLVPCDEGVILAAPDDNSSNNNNTIMSKLTNVNGVVHELMCFEKTKKSGRKAHTKLCNCAQCWRSIVFYNLNMSYAVRCIPLCQTSVRKDFSDCFVECVKEIRYINKQAQVG